VSARRLISTALAAAVGFLLASVHASRAQPPPGAQPAPPPRAGDRLPEDPVLGAKSTAQWRQHMIEEEHERKLHYDRDRLKQHRAVVKFLVATRARYDRAKSKAAVSAIQTRLPPAVDAVRKQITAIDKWGTNSNLLEDYDAFLKALSDGYPTARIAALDGDRAPLDALRADLDRRTKHIKDWLTEAAESKDE
jgi:hypothetical protein